MWGPADFQAMVDEPPKHPCCGHLCRADSQSFREITVVDLHARYPIKVPQYFCDECHTRFVPPPTTFICWGSSPQSPRTFYTWRFLTAFEALSIHSPKVSVHAFSETFDEVHRLLDAQLTDLSAKTLSTALRYFLRLLRTLQDPRELGVVGIAPGILHRCPSCAHVPLTEPPLSSTESPSPEDYEPAKEQHQLCSISLDVTFKPRIASAGATEDQVGVRFESDVLVPKDEVVASLLEYEGSGSSRSAAADCNSFRAANSAPLPPISLSSKKKLNEQGWLGAFCDDGFAAVVIPVLTGERYVYADMAIQRILGKAHVRTLLYDIMCRYGERTRAPSG